MFPWISRKRHERELTFVLEALEAERVRIDEILAEVRFSRRRDRYAHVERIMVELPDDLLQAVPLPYLVDRLARHFAKELATGIRALLAARAAARQKEQSS